MHAFKQAYDLKTKQNTKVVFYEGDDAIKELSKVDSFIDSMSEFDIQARTYDSNASSKSDYINFLSKQVLSWKDEQIEKINQTIQYLNTSEQAQSILKHCNFPDEIIMILTDNQDEYNAAYCRNLNVIVFHPSKPSLTSATSTNTNDQSKLIDLTNGSNWHTTFMHELFHIISRNNHNLRDKLYECIDYHRIQSINDYHPNKLKSLKITNPDSPIIQHYIKLFTISSPTELSLVPILCASKCYSKNDKMSLFKYLKPRFLILGTYHIVCYEDVVGLYDKIGNNTDYDIHPEEILADNFELMLNDSDESKIKIKSPDIISRMKDVLTNFK